MATLLSVNVGLPKDVEWQGRTVHTGIWKRPVDGPQRVRRLNIDGDGQGDLAGHGGEQRAVLVYQAESYSHWQEQLGRKDLEPGQFGENFTVDGLGDDEVHIGDRYRIGTAEFEVTQPRVTCFRVGMRLGVPEMPALLVAHHRPGFYLRVIREGEVRAGDQVTRTRIGRHRMTVAEIDALLYLPGRDIGRLRAAVDLPALSPGWQQSFHELLDSAEHPAYAAGPDVGVEPGWPGFRALRVDKVVAESSTISSIYLAAADGTPLPVARAGQYLTLRVAGAGEPPPVRSYSLSSRPGDGEYRISVKREAHGLVSGYLQAEVQSGTSLEVAAPRGDFVLADGSEPVLLISAGVGVTPVLAMLQQLAAMQSERPVWWIHVARDARQQAFGAEAHRLLAALPDAHEYVFHTAPDAVSSDDGSVLAGRPSLAALTALDLPADATAYICGPAAFMADLGEDLQQLGIGSDRVHTEVFGTRSAINPGVVGARAIAPHQPPAPAATARVGPAVTFARSGLTVDWTDGYRSLLELAEACDVPTRWSCRTGVCHTCVTPLLSGEIGYAPSPLELPAGQEALICCSQPASPVVLDL